MGRLGLVGAPAAMSSRGMEIRGETSASVRAGGGAQRQWQNGKSDETQPPHATTRMPSVSVSGGCSTTTWPADSPLVICPSL